MSVYIGRRDSSFKNMIRKILIDAECPEEYVSTILNDEGLAYFDASFTHKSANEHTNYEFLETLGDSTLNKIIVWYITRRFPQLNCPDGIDVFTKLKHFLEQKKSFRGISESFGFWEFISAEESFRQSEKEKKSILEDVLEAFFGTLEILLDKIKIGLGYAICYRIFAKRLDRIELPLTHEFLTNPITRLKEVVDYYKNRPDEIGTIEAEKQKVRQVGVNKIYKVLIVQTIQQTRHVIGSGEGIDLKEANEKASEEALQSLKLKNIKRPSPAAYAKFCI